LVLCWFAAERELELRRQQPEYFTAHKLAVALRESGQPDEALQLHLEAVRGYERTHARDDGWAVEPLLDLGKDLLALRRPAEAVAPLERALRQALTADDLQAHTQLALARALWDARGDRARAQKLAAQALATFRDLDERRGSYYRAYRLDAERWISGHQRPQAQAQLAPHQP
jgi:tetratricopeptide (TPR) repeat protein